MRFLLDAEQRAFASSLDAMLASADTPSAVRAWADGDHAPGRVLWSRLAEAGVFALAVPEVYEGWACFRWNWRSLLWSWAGTRFRVRWWRRWPPPYCWAS